jgi:probable rRNA maturation factor
MQLNKDCVERVVFEVLTYEKKTTSHVEIMFVGDPTMRKLHKEFFNDSSSTDCMSFPMDNDCLGSVVICPKTALSLVGTTGFWEELTLYLVHGMLHLIGYKDENPKDRKFMHHRQDELMSHLKEKRFLLGGILTRSSG